MAAKKGKNGDAWVEQAVVVKKSHPYGKTAGQAEIIAERHAKKKARAKVESAATRRFIIRPKECFADFRGQSRGPHVTVFWGKLKPSARRRKACR